MIIPFLNTGKRTTTFALLLLLALILLVFTGLGVFRLYFDFDWYGTSSPATGTEAAASADAQLQQPTTPHSDLGQLFSLTIHGGNSFNLFAADNLGSNFWVTLCLSIAAALLMPFFRPAGAAIVALAAAGGIVWFHYTQATAAPAIPLEFELLTLFVLFVMYVILSMWGEVRDRRKIGTVLSQYVPPELATEYNRNPDRMGLEGDSREVTVLFCDIIGFTSISASLSPREVAQWLNAYFSCVSRIIVRHQGTIDKYMGDSVMAFWGAPVESDRHAEDALSAAFDIQQELPRLSDELLDKGFPPLSAGIGISTGVVNVGNLGTEYRRTYTAVGRAVNEAEQLETCTRQYDVPIVVSESTADALDHWLFRELDVVPAKGGLGSMKVFQPLAERDEADDALLDSLNKHRQAMSACEAGDWPTAVRLFEELREEWEPGTLYDQYLQGISQTRPQTVR